MDKISLSGSWELYFDPERVDSLEGAKKRFQHITAVVPGEVYLDLLREGIIEDPFFGRNYFKLRSFEFYQW